MRVGCHNRFMNERMVRVKSGEKKKRKNRDDDYRPPPYAFRAPSLGPCERISEDLVSHNTNTHMYDIILIIQSRLCD